MRNQYTTELGYGLFLILTMAAVHNEYITEIANLALALCIIISFLILWSILPSASLVKFKKCPEYLTRHHSGIYSCRNVSPSVVAFSFSGILSDFLLLFCLFGCFSS